MSQYERNNMMGKFGMLFQGGALFDSIPVWRNISFALLQSGKLNEQSRQYIYFDI